MPSAHEKARLAKKKEAAKKKGGKKAVDEVVYLFSKGHLITELLPGEG